MNRTVLVAMALGLLPGVAAAQGDPELKVRVGQEVWVGTHAGRTIHGAIEAITADQLTIGNAQRATVDRRDILQVRVRDGLRDGAILGAIAGAGSSFFMGPLCDDGHCTAEPVIIMAVVGAGLGTLIDALTPRKLVYDRARRDLAVAPLAGRRLAGVALRWTWSGSSRTPLAEHGPGAGRRPAVTPR